MDLPLLATVSNDGAWIVASFSRDAGNVWTDPALTSQHVDPQSTLAPGEHAVLEVKILVLHGVLHLAGYDHEKDDGEMAEKESRLRTRLGLPAALIERASGRVRGPAPRKARA